MTPRRILRGAGLVAAVLAVALLIALGPRSVSDSGQGGSSATAAPLSERPAVATSTGCGPALELLDVAEPTPIEGRRGQPITPPLLETGELRAYGEASLPSGAFLLPPATADGKQVQALLVNGTSADPAQGEPMVRVYYGERSVGPDDRFEDFVAAGGIVLEESLGEDRDVAWWHDMFSNIGRSPLPPTFEIGPLTGVAVHGDPIVRNDIRPWHLHWSEGGRNFTVVGATSSAVLVDFARSMYCP